MPLGKANFLGWNRALRNVVLYRHGPNREAGDAETGRLNPGTSQPASALGLARAEATRARGGLRRIGVGSGRPAMSPDGTQRALLAYQEDERPKLAWQQRTRGSPGRRRPVRITRSASLHCELCGTGSLEHSAAAFSFHHADLRVENPSASTCFSGTASKPNSSGAAALAVRKCGHRVFRHMGPVRRLARVAPVACGQT